MSKFKGEKEKRNIGMMSFEKILFFYHYSIIPAFQHSRIA